WRGLLCRPRVPGCPAGGSIGIGHAGLAGIVPVTTAPVRTDTRRACPGPVGSARRWPPARGNG
ncbi:MAG: hypothetical protein AVDCRST_MAG33-19, partial [uncultured Thermomicrobiales bacterium]